MVLHFFIFLLLSFSVHPQSYVQYDLSDGRFGDHLTDYLHGRWVQYKSGLPLLFSPFEYSDALKIEENHAVFPVEDLLFDRVVGCYKIEDVELEEGKDLLFKIPHFTTFSMDAVINVPLGKAYFPKCFLVDWRDKAFLDVMRDEICLHEPSIALFKPEEEHISIALHYRDGGSYDQLRWRWCFPLRFPPQEYYLNALTDLIATLPPAPIFVGVFTDALIPENILQAISSELRLKHPGRHIEAVLSPGSKGDGGGVLEDFFSIAKFQYVIGSESLFSQNAARIGRCVLSLKPQLFARDKSDKNISSTVALDMRYKAGDQISYHPTSGVFTTDLQEIMKRLWLCYQNECFFDLTLSSPLYERLKLSFLKPRGADSPCHLPSIQSIDWQNPIFSALAREIFSPKEAFRLVIDKEVPSIAILDTVKDVALIKAIIEGKEWAKCQMTLIKTKKNQIGHEEALKAKLIKQLRKLGLKNLEVLTISFEDDPLQAFINVGHHDYVVTTPCEWAEISVHLFGSHPPIVIQ